jgi:hypothetical protein
MIADKTCHTHHQNEDEEEKVEDVLNPVWKLQTRKSD